jgi:hypothetical protein
MSLNGVTRQNFRDPQWATPCAMPTDLGRAGIRVSAFIGPRAAA